jgi:hypothetical protein
MPILVAWQAARAAGEDVVGSVDQRLRELDRDEPGLFRQVERRALLETRQRSTSEVRRRWQRV